MKPFLIKENIFWIGSLHPDLRIFDIIMHTKNGTTYNSYLIRDQKIAIIDTVKEKFSDQYINHIKEIIDPADIDYIVVQHNEPDHSGSLKKLLKLAPKAQVVCSKSAIKYVTNIVNEEMKIIPVANNETIVLGQKTLRFLNTPYVHWPDTMMTYIEDENVLFTCDFMGAHFCDSRMVDTEITRNFWPDFKLYFDYILRPYKKNVNNALKKVMDVEIELIAPSHGPIITENITKYLKAYQMWSSPLPANDPPIMLVYYASAHENTAHMAKHIVEGAASEKVAVECYDAMDIKVGTHIDKIESADAILVGSPTINNDAVKPIWDILNSLTTIDVKGKTAASFGSYAWSGQATKLLDTRLQDLKFSVPFEGLQVVLVPSNDDLQECYNFGKKLAQHVKSKIEN